jgi:hypothetical protein
MTDQHRATPEQWASQEQWASPPDSDPYALCLLELRARVEALEAAPAFRVLETGERIQMNIVQDKLDRLIALDREDPTPDPAMDELRAASAEAQPAGGLVERVAQGIAAADDEGLTNMTWNYHARAAIREVAAWLRENDSECQMGGDADATAELLEQEADR